MHKLVWRGGDSLRVLAVFQGEQSFIPNTILYPPTLAPNEKNPMPFSGLCGLTHMYTCRHTWHIYLHIQTQTQTHTQ